MTSQARTDFLTGLDAFGSACDESAVRGGDAVGDFFRRGLTVAAYNLLETFLKDRLGEIAAHINTGSSHFLDLPDRLQRRAIIQTLKVAANQMGRGTWDIGDLRDFSESVGKSLSAVGRSVHLSPLTWTWSGSNIAAEDYASALKLMHVESPFPSILKLSARLGFPSVDQNGDPIDLMADFKALAAERHKCAHVASYGVTNIWLRAVPAQILRFALGFDAFASVSADLIRSGDADFLADEKWLNDQKISVRFVKERAKDYAEILEGRVKALHVGDDAERIFKNACTASSPLQIVVQQTKTGKLVNWSVPSVG